MKKLFTKIASFVLGLGLAVGVGVSVSTSQISEVKAATNETHEFSQSFSQLLNNDASIASIEIPQQTYTIKKIELVCRYNKAIDPAVEVNVTVGSDALSEVVTVGNNFNGTKSWELDTPKSGKVTFSFTNKCGSGTGKGTFYVTNVILTEGGQSASLNSIDALEGTLEAHVGDKSWNLTTLTPKGTLDDDPGKVVDISDYVELKTDDVPGTELGSKKVTVHVIDLLKTVASKAFDVDGEVLAIPPVPVTHTMADCYTVDKGTNVKFNGVYMGAYGTNPYQGIFFADGEYGIMVYGTSSVSSDWEVGKTVLAISGVTDYYNGLVQIKSASFQVTSATVAVPVVYEFTGAETTPVALSRKTSLSGKVTELKNAFESDKDTTVTIDLGGEKSASIFVKKGVFTNAQLAEFKAGFVVDNEVTVTGFLNYYKYGQTIDTAYTPSAFQIIVPTIVKVGTYTAHDYALDFISATDAVCSTPFGEDGHLTGLLAIWTELNTKYSALKDAEKVAFANPDTTDTDIKAAIARYDYICGKYNAGGVVLTEFVEGHIVPTLSLAFTRDYKVQTNTPMIIVICCAVASVTALGILIVIKRRKSSVK
mgnify:CR=1 FL=1